MISIHALRVEGDGVKSPSIVRLIISIHALRVEGDWSATPAQSHPRYFYPRPPGGGRRTKYNAAPPEQDISIHALRVEGDPAI